ncbi:hypothetical protein ACIRRX_08565 [Streptomyces bacillaris]
MAAEDVGKVGQEAVRGVSATCCSGTVDAAEPTARDSALDDRQPAAFEERFTAAGITTRTAGIRVGQDDLLVKKTERDESGIGVSGSTVFSSDYGTGVPLERPPTPWTSSTSWSGSRGSDPPDLRLNPPRRDGRRRICPARPRSRTLHRKPKTAGRRCAPARGTVTEGSARSDDLRR